MLLRDLVSAPEVHDVEVPPCPDQTIVLVVSGGKWIESRAGGRTRRARYGPGTLALTAPGTPGRFSWRGEASAPQRALHLQIPARTMAGAVAGIGAPVRLPDTLSARDPVLEQVVRALEVAGRAGADDLYAESAAVFLAVHLVTVYSSAVASPAGREDARVRQAQEFMRDCLAEPLTLAEMAQHVHLSPYHFARVFRQAVGEPPRAHLTRLRVDAACRLLRETREPVADVAAACGFTSAARLTAAMRRLLGTGPTAYRAAAQRR